MAGGEEAPEAGPSSSFFTRSGTSPPCAQLACLNISPLTLNPLAHTLGSDETPSTYIPDPTAGQPGGGAGEEEEEEEEVAVRHLTFWQDGFSIEDGDLMSYDEHRDLLAAIQSGSVLPFARSGYPESELTAGSLARLQPRPDLDAQSETRPAGRAADRGTSFGAVDPPAAAAAGPLLRVREPPRRRVAVP